MVTRQVRVNLASAAKLATITADVDVNTGNPALGGASMFFQCVVAYQRGADTQHDHRRKQGRQNE